MVAHVNKSFSLGLIVVLGLFVVSSYARFSMMVTKDEIHAICTKKGVNSSLCFEILKPTPEILALDFSGLIKFLINYESRNVSDTLNQLKLFAENTTSTDYRSTYRECVQLYEMAVDDFDTSLKALAAKDYDGLNLGIGASLTEMDTCEDDLLTINPLPHFFIKRGTLIKNLCSINLVILECFLREKKILS
ncbi:Pectinesterase inhibitor 1 [Cardamine amara subsp. amara]|uniref:Pectinesterase inhibitor 1 n=1 Tax=Cardamine amara subsp. amara TaxID=228776 RepID=A0ABD0Z1S5_CARAN